MAPSRADIVRALLAILFLASKGWAQPATAGAPTRGVRTLVTSQHLRVPLPGDVTRIAVGDPDILGAELVSNRELLLLGRQPGRTSLLVWFADGTIRDEIVSVLRDLSLLQRALDGLGGIIRVEGAPDRDAVVLTGTVPDATVSIAAERIARDYLGSAAGRAAAQPTLIGIAPPAAPVPDTPAAGSPAGAAPVRLPDAPQQAAGTTATVINLLQLETLPGLPEDRIRDAIRTIGGERVTVRRVLRGSVRDDSADVLLLEGQVPNQVALVRILSVASQLFAGRSASAEDIRVVADESGSLSGRAVDSQNQQNLGGRGGRSSLGIPGLNQGRSNLTNQVLRNLGRAKVIEVADGRVLSFLTVTDLPQVRVNLRLYEVRRSKLLTYEPNYALLGGDFDQPPLLPAGGATAVQGDAAARVGSGSRQVQNVLSFLNGRLTDQLQLALGHWAIDAAFSLLERDGIARAVAAPTLTVLSGEMAQFQVGGEVPVPQAFATAFGGAGASTDTTTPGVFNFVEFIPFGVVLQVRPLVGEDDTITLDVQPQVVTPDPDLTVSLRATTGQSQPATAFETRSLTTSARLRDGQGLVVGGLASRNDSDTVTGTPGVRNIPGLGWLFKGTRTSSEDLELVVVVNPVILRDPIPTVPLWSFPTAAELVVGLPQPGVPPPPPPKP